MSLRRHIGLIFTSALAVTALTACGLSGSHPRADAPSRAAAVGHRTPPASPTPSPSPSPTASATVSATTDPTPSPTPSSSPSPSGPVLVNFHRAKVQLPISSSTVPTAPAGLVQALGIYLDHLWKTDFKDDPGCEQEVTAYLGRTRSDGFAWVDISFNPMLSSCASAYGGGYFAVFAQPAGVWQAVISGQDQPTCAQLERYGVPSDILGDDATCYDPSSGQEVSYTHA
jgi:hypothetical protein